MKKTIPLALGDNYKGFRIVGTNHDYVAHYGARARSRAGCGRRRSRRCSAPTSRRATGLGLDATFTGAHGIGGGEGEQMHDEHPYRVVGVLAPDRHRASTASC